MSLILIHITRSSHKTNRSLLNLDSTEYSTSRVLHHFCRLRHGHYPVRSSYNRGIFIFGLEEDKWRYMSWFSFSLSCNMSHLTIHPWYIQNANQDLTTSFGHPNLKIWRPGVWLVSPRQTAIYVMCPSDHNIWSPLPRLARPPNRVRKCLYNLRTLKT